MRQAYVKIASYFVYFALFCSIELFLRHAALGGSIAKRDLRRNRGTIMMSDILARLDKKRIDKRTIETASLGAATKPVRASSLQVAEFDGKIHRNNLTERLGMDAGKKETRWSTGRKDDGRVLKLANKSKKEKLIKNNSLKTLKNKSNKSDERKPGNRTLARVSVNNRSQQSKSNSVNRKRNLLKHRKNKRFRNKHRKELVKQDKRYLRSFLPIRRHFSKWPIHRHHLVKVPMSSIASPYRLWIRGYPRFQRNKIYYGDPAYDDSYYYDDYYDDEERKDVIPKPNFASITEGGSKKDSFYKEKGEKRNAYSPIVSAVQNLDQSEANLFDSLFSTSHETNRLTDTIGNELASFTGTPNDLELYSPTDTPGELYFEKDNAGSPQDFSQFGTRASTRTPTQPGVDPSEIVDNEEKLLSIVEKVIEKQKKKKEKDKMKSEVEVDKNKPQSTVVIGDTSEVFNVGSPDHGAMEAKDVDKLEDFLSKQPRFEKKIASGKAMKNDAATSAKQKKIQHKVKDHSAKDKAIKGQSVKEQNVKGQRMEAQSVKGHNTKGLNTNFKVHDMDQRVQNDEPTAKFESTNFGQHVIVENISPKNDNLLMESMRQAGDEDERLSKSPIRQTQSRKVGAKGRSFAKGAKMHRLEHHVIKEIIKEKAETEDVGGTRKDEPGDEKQHSFELMPSSIRHADASRYAINGERIPVVSESNPSDWFKDDVTHGTSSGIKKDVDQPAGSDTASIENGNAAEKEANDGAEAKMPPKEDPKIVTHPKNGTTKEQEAKALPEKPTEQKVEEEEDIADWFKSDGSEPQPPIEPPPEVESVTAPKPENRTPGWRIRDYYLDNQNASNWDQIRTAWTNRNGSAFVFNNRIQVNPQNNQNPVPTMPVIRFVDGMTMPTLPTMAAPTGVPMHGTFPDENDDDDDDFPNQNQPMHQQQLQQQQQRLGQQQQQQQTATTPSYGLQYPWQWHNRRPKGGRYHGTHLHFHGKPTVSGVVVTTKHPVSVGQGLIITRPAIVENIHGQESSSGNFTASTEEGGNGKKEDQHEEKATAENLKGNKENNANNNKIDFSSKGKDQEKGQDESKGDLQEEGKEKGQKEEGKDKGQQGEGKDRGQQEEGKDRGQGEDRYQGMKVINENSQMGGGESSLKVTEPNQSSTTGSENKELHANEIARESSEAARNTGGGGRAGGEGKWSENVKDDGVLTESMTHRNTTVRRLGEKHAFYNAKINMMQPGNNTSFTKPPKELPILSEPTTKSVQSFLPGVRPPSTASNGMQAERKSSEYPPWSGGYVEHLRKFGLGGRENVVRGEARNKGIGKVDGSEGKADDQLSRILVEESTRKIPYDENAKQLEKSGAAEDEEKESKASFAYESNLLQKEETENAANRARVSDTPINLQAESINLIRQRATASQKAAQRQQVFGENQTNDSYASAKLPGKDLQQQVSQVEMRSQERGSKEQTSPFMISQRNMSQNSVTDSQIPLIFSTTETSQKQTTRYGTTSRPKTTPTQTALVIEEIHHPTPIPLFPIVKSPIRVSTSENKANDKYEAPPKGEYNAASSNASYSQPAGLNTSTVQQSELPRPQGSKTESTTPSAIGYKTTDWAQAFTTTERTGKYPLVGQSTLTNQAPATSEQISVAKNPTGPVTANQSPVQYNNTQYTVVEGTYQTDTATMRTTPARTEQQLLGPPSGYSYASSYPNVNNGLPSYASPQANASPQNMLQASASPQNILQADASPQNMLQANAYAPTGNFHGWNPPSSQAPVGKNVDALSDSYLTKFGDQLNMEDLYWTDSTEEKEQICKQEKGTNEVIHLLCFGDSLTRGYYNKGKSHHPYTNKLQFLLNKLDTKKCYIVENEGKDGELAYEEMPKRLESLFNDGGAKYEWTVILGGTNDIYNKKRNKKATEDEITKNIISMHEIARQHNSKSVAVTIPEVYCETQETCQDAKQLRERVNGNIRNYAYQNQGRVVLVDLADMLQRSNVGRDMAAQFFEGGLHLKPRGYERMAIIIFEGLKRTLS